jgi:hypothetical protein
LLAIRISSNSASSADLPNLNHSVFKHPIYRAQDQEHHLFRLIYLRLGMTALTRLIVIECCVASIAQVSNAPIMWLDASALAKALRPHTSEMRSDNAALTPGAAIYTAFIPR